MYIYTLGYPNKIFVEFPIFDRGEVKELRFYFSELLGIFFTKAMEFRVEAKFILPPKMQRFDFRSNKFIVFETLP